MAIVKESKVVEVTVVELKAVPSILVPGAYDVTIGEKGQAMTVAWPLLPGATAARLSGSASVRIGPPGGTVSAQALPLGASGDWLRIDVPANRAVYGITCTGLTARPAGKALVVAVSAGGPKPMPIAAVGGPTRSGVLPGPLLPEITLDNGRLQLPAPVVTTEVFLTFVEGDIFGNGTLTKPSAMRIDAELSKPTGALSLTGPDGTKLWGGTPVPLSGLVPIDVTDALRTGLEATLGAAGGPKATFTLRGPPATVAALRFSAPSGRLVREWPGTLGADLAGEPVPLPLGAPVLPATAPQRATAAHLAVRYHGVRLHDTLRDELPPRAQAVSGPVVGERPVVRTLAPLQLAGPPAVRVAVIGRAPQPCTIAVGLADATGTTFAGRPGTLELPASADVGVHWVELAEPPEPVADRAPPAAVIVRALSGRFLWADGPGGPRVRVAVADPDPGGRPVRLAGATIATPHQTNSELRDITLAPGALKGGTPLVASDLFCRVEITGLALEHAR